MAFTIFTDSGANITDKVRDHYDIRIISLTLVMDGEEFQFSEGFTDLHTESYRRILANEGFGLDDARPSIEIVSQIRNATPIGLKGDYHPLAKLPLARHPFGWPAQLGII